MYFLTVQQCISLQYSQYVYLHCSQHVYLHCSLGMCTENPPETQLPLESCVADWQILAHVLVSYVGVWNVFTIWLWMYIYHLRHIRWEQDKIDFDFVFHPGQTRLAPLSSVIKMMSRNSPVYFLYSTAKVGEFSSRTVSRLSLRKRCHNYLNSPKPASAQVAPQLRAETPIAPS